MLVPVVVVLVVFCMALASTAGGAAAPSGGTGALNLQAIPAEYRDAVVAAGKRCKGISAPVIAAQIDAESAWNPNAISPVGAKGLSQFMSPTWAEFGKDYSGDGIADANDPLDAIGSQADYMCHLYRWVSDQLEDGSIDGDPLRLALAAYNAGTGRVLAAAGVPAIVETRTYVDKIMNGIALYTRALASGEYASGDGPAVSADGTYREAEGGSGRLDRSALCQIPWAAAGQLLRCDALRSLVDLNSQFRAEFGENIEITDAYRDYATQVATKAAKGYLAAEPGWSNHRWGLAIDLGNVGAEGSERHRWIRQHGPAYGWQHPSWARVDGRKPEAWHFEFVGIGQDG
jgi:hypothetical protein